MIHSVERLLIVSTALLAVSVAIHFWDSFYFATVFASEDGPVEYATTFFLFIGGAILTANAAALWRRRSRGGAALMAFYGLLFFFAAGEEISWGQRIFGWESSEFFQQNNKQFETNIHNLVLGDTHLAETLFGNALTAVILLYLVALPPLYPRVGWVRRLADRFVVPVPGIRHSVFAVVASLVIAVIDQNRKWEVYELIFSLLMVSIFLLPQNRDKVR